MINTALAPYGAHLTNEGFIARADKVTGIRVVKKGRRLRFESESGQLFMSGPVSAQAVSEFVEKFWFWERVA